MASLFDTLQTQAFRAGITARTDQSRAWFQKKVGELAVPSRSKLMKDKALGKASNVRGQQVIGNMYMYFYDPKHKETLPYYDRFPLSIIVEPAPKGFYGLNLHYLNYNTRAAFLDNLMELAPQKVSQETRLRKLRYDLLKSTKRYREFKPCFKHYLSQHVKSRFSQVYMTEWEIAIFLPVEQFTKASKSAVWKDSIKIARS